MKLPRLTALSLAVLFLTSNTQEGSTSSESPLPRNHLFRALQAASNLPRKGILAVDATGVFAPELEGMTFENVVSEMRDLGLTWPLAIPAPNSDTGISAPDDLLRKIPASSFRPYDRVVVYMHIDSAGFVHVTDATIVNTAATP